MEAVVLRELRVEGREEMQALAEGDDCARVAGVGVVLVVWYGSLALGEE